MIAASGAKYAYTTTTAVLNALRCLGSKRLTIITPYPDDVNEQEAAYFAGEGFTIQTIHGIRTSDPRNHALIRQITPQTIYEFACAHLAADTDTLFLSCTGLHAIDLIRPLEEKLGIPVVTSNQCAIWQIGKHFGCHHPQAAAIGQLFTR